MDKIKWVANGMPKTADASLPVMSLENVKKARAFHESFPQYAETPLAKLDGMAKYLGLKKLFVKDESYRFGLNAFKVLGGSFAMANYIAEAVGKDVSECDYAYLTSEKLREEFGQATFFTATDGNHGRGVAWAANRLGQKAVVLMPKGSTKTRFDNIAKEGAKVTIEEVNYDECVRRANALAEATEHGVMVQDTAWDGYEKIPAWIMEGYGTMASEAVGAAGRAADAHLRAGGRGQPGGRDPGLLREPLSGQLPDDGGHGGAGGGLPVPQRGGGRRRASGLPRATCRRSWRGWPAASRTRSASTY